MFKLILFLLVALGASLYFPASRVVVLEKAQPVLNPVLRWSTTGEMRKIVRELATHERSYDKLPEPREFSAWLEAKYRGGPTEDAWGNDYTLRVWPDSFAVISPGVDGERGGLDDIQVSERRVTTPRRRRR